MSAPEHKLQSDPPEGARDVVDRELGRQPPAAGEGAVDPTAKINGDDPADVRRWAERLGLSEDQLVAMMRQVGNSVAAIQGEIATE
jgi:hypothetical protein